MLLTLSQFFKIFFITLTLCCLTTSVFGGLLTKTEIPINETDVAAAIEADVKTEEVAAATKETKSNFSKEDNYVMTDNENGMVKKSAVQPAADTSVSVWGIVRGFWNWIREDISESLFGDDEKITPVGESRTFGKIRRLQMALIPIVFKFGVLSAMVTFLVVLGLKTFFLVKVLVVMNLLALLAKFFTLKSHFGHVEHLSGPPAPMWNPYLTTGWHSTPEEHPVNKEIHLHIHGGGHILPQASTYSYGSDTAAQTHGWEKRNDPYSAYDNIALQGQKIELIANELPATVSSVASKTQQYGSSFPGNHRMF